MIPLLAKNAVNYKCNYNDARLTGNYECAYALGIVAGVSGQDDISEIEDFGALKKSVMETAGEYTGNDARIKRVFELARDYECNSESDEQMLELFHTGYEDAHL